jgi:antitoxin component YwqK of YwqJK toxin-antitoxin module
MGRLRWVAAVAVLALSACESSRMETVRVAYPGSSNVRFTGMLEHTDRETNCRGEWFFYYPDGMPQAKGSFGRGEPLRDGAFKHDNTVIPLLGREGPWTLWSPDGTKLSEGRYVDGRREGFWRFWTETGALRAEGVYHDDRPNGVHATWFESGTKRTEGAYIGGRAIGEHLRWDENETLRERGSFVAGRPEGVHEDWDECGVLREHALYEGGLLHGARRLWTGDGRLASEAAYQAGLQDGLQVLFHPGGTVRQISTYAEGRLHGPQTAFDRAGETLHQLVFVYGEVLELGPRAGRRSLRRERVAGGPRDEGQVLAVEPGSGEGEGSTSAREGQ